MVLGGKPVIDYAPDFWLISDGTGGAPCGYVTSPWYSPELETNIALGWVPVGLKDLGTKLKVWLPEEYASVPGAPFRPSANPNAREIAKAEGRDSAF